MIRARLGLSTDLFALLADPMKFFTNSSKRQTKKSSSHQEEKDRGRDRDFIQDDDELPAYSPSSAASYSASPLPGATAPNRADKPRSKPVTPSNKSASTTKKSTPLAAASPTSNSNYTTDQKRSSRSYPRTSSDLKSSSSRKKKNKLDLDTHPLNLHPDEYKRLSALSAMSARDSVDRMDVDPPNDATSAPSSPSSQSQRKQSSTPPSDPAESAATAPAEPATNGDTSPKTEDAPAPPPHTTDPNSPPPTTADEAEVFKVLGNKFFKEKNYKRAIEEYTKGKHLPFF